MYKDDDADNINDLDAPFDDCNPADIVDGPTGNVFRCVNVSGPGQLTVAYCLPGSGFTACASNVDCPNDEVCSLSNVGGSVELRCVAAYRETSSWSTPVVRLGQACNEDPAMDALAYCQDGLCLDDGRCSSFCSADAHWDTTLFDVTQRCVGSLCTNAPSRACVNDSDCSTLVCTGSLDLGGGATFSYCAARP